MNTDNTPTPAEITQLLNTSPASGATAPTMKTHADTMNTPSVFALHSEVEASIGYLEDIQQGLTDHIRAAEDRLEQVTNTLQDLEDHETTLSDLMEQVQTTLTEAADHRTSWEVIDSEVMGWQ